jgi:hypothetical protein
MGPCCERRKQINNTEISIATFLRDAKNNNTQIGSEDMLKKAIYKIIDHGSIDEISRIYIECFKYFDSYQHDEYGDCFQYVMNIDDLKMNKFMCFVFINKKENSYAVELFPSKSFE